MWDIRSRVVFRRAEIPSKFLEPHGKSPLVCVCPNSETGLESTDRAQRARGERTGPDTKTEASANDPATTCDDKGLGGAPGTTRTCDLLVRSQTLYPTELRARKAVCPQFTTPSLVSRYPRHPLPDHQRVNVIRPFVRLHRLQVAHVPHDRILVHDPVRSQ